MRAPFFVLEGNDVGAYADYHALERHLEPVDVQEGSYRVFDSAGTEIGLSVFKGRVKVGEPIGSDPQLLEATLRNFLTHVGERWDIDVTRLPQNDLPDLVRAFDGRIRGGPKN